jgi:hypothetical protein
MAKNAGEQAVGVRAIVSSEVHVCRAGLIVLSAGTFGSADVLVRSGIGVPY